jgi:hypothetical protein
MPRDYQAEKLDPQPQELVALGFWKTNPRPMISSLKSIWVPLKLAVSSFHTLHVGHISWNDNLARALKQARKGDWEGAAKSFDTAFSRETFKSEKGAWGREQWALPEHLRSEEGKQAVRLMEEGSFVPTMSREFGEGLTKKVKDAWEEGNVLKTSYYGARHAAQQAWMFEHWIPSKTASISTT